jgi:hypothetical protein
MRRTMHNGTATTRNSRGLTAPGGGDGTRAQLAAHRGLLAPGYCRKSKCVRVFIALLIVSPLVFAGCGKKSDAPPETDAEKQHARSQVEQGPVRVTVEVEPANARLSDEPKLTLTIDHEEGVAVEKPLFGSTLGRFIVRDLCEPLPRIDNGREIIRQIYTLEPTEAGRLRIDPICVRFTDRRPSGDGKTHTIETEAISVEVSSIVGDKPLSLSDVRPPAAPVALPSHGLPWMVVAVVVLVVAVAAAWIWRRRRHEAPAAAVILSPEEIANQELDALATSGLAERDVKEFYVKLTGIVRSYIEQTTGIRAPEQTTEEFLREIGRRRPLSLRERARVRADDAVTVLSSSASVGGDSRRRLPETVASPSPPTPLPLGEGSFDETRSSLRDFLESADLVKFAAHRPHGDAVAESIRRARVFVAGNKSACETASEKSQI